MSFYFEINGIYAKSVLEELDGTSINIFIINQISQNNEKLIQILLDGNQKSLICQLIKEIYQYFSLLYIQIHQQKQFDASNDQLAEQFYQYLSQIQISLKGQNFFLRLNKKKDNHLNEITNQDSEKNNIFFQVLEQIYGRKIEYVKQEGINIRNIIVEYLRSILIKRFKGYKLNYQKQKQLVLLQNGDIIISKFNNEKTISFSTSRIIHNQTPRFCQLQKLLLEQYPLQIISEGMLDNNFDYCSLTNIYSKGQLIYQGYMDYGLLNGEGKILNLQNLEIYNGNFVYNKKHGFGSIFYNQQIFYGQFSNDMMNGPFQIKGDQNGQIYYFYNDQLVTQQEYQQLSYYTIQSENGVQIIPRIISNQDVTQSICSYKEFNITIQAYKALNPGFWLFETQVDYFLGYFKNYFTMTQKKSNKETVIFNTNETSNFINCDYESQFHSNEKLYLEQDQSIRAKKRKVFVMNISRSHFLIMIEDNKQLYVCDSLYKQNKNLEAAFYNLLKIEDRRCRVLNCAQQKNGYDCGIFALFYAIQFMKYENLNMNEIQKKLCLSDSSQFRWQLIQFVKYNHDYILKNF